MGSELQSQNWFAMLGFALCCSMLSQYGRDLGSAVTCLKLDGYEVEAKSNKMQMGHNIASLVLVTNKYYQ